ncbi:hypothetical protein KAT92_03540 [Candidatus Babeliales bacterium]|nr:hypothetical protein [Candidatus Babeliales bacterium]
MKIESAIPTHLFIGSETQLHDLVVQQLQYAFCKHQIPANSGCFCYECQKIKNNQHASIVWIEPEKKYVLDDLTIIFEKIRFALDPEQSFFFILKKAHLLTTTCANKLLKTLEEPPPGYKFILLTNNEHAIIPTIRSRSHVHHLQEKSSFYLDHPLLSFLIDPHKIKDPFGFEQELRKVKPNEQETIELLHQLINSIQKQLHELYKSCSNENQLEELELSKKFKNLEETHNFLQKQLKKLPQPGSATLFWKQLFLTIPQETRSS